jgi:hypothetical protein
VDNLAAFTIQGTPSEDPVSGDRIYRSRSGDTLALTLETNPAAGVTSVTYELYDASDPSSPLASKSAREWWPTALLFTESGATRVTPAGPQDVVHLPMPPGTGLPGGGAASWICRCRALTDSGEIVFERGIALNAFPDSYRETIPGERGEFEAVGWNRTLDAQVQNSFPVRKKFAHGSTVAVGISFVGPIVPTKSRTCIASLNVSAVKSGGGESIWAIKRRFTTDSGGTVAASASAIITSKSTGGTQVADTDWLPSIEVNSGAIAVKLNQQQAGFYLYDAWLEVTEQPL